MLRLNYLRCSSWVLIFWELPEGSLNKFRGPAAQGCAAIFQRHKLLENGANRKTHFSICVV